MSYMYESDQLMHLACPSVLQRLPDSDFCKVELCAHNRIDSPHWHNFVQIWYTRKGSYIHNLCGREYLMPHGSIIVVPPFSVHYIETLNSKNTEIICLNFSSNYFSHIFENDGAPALFASRTDGVYFFGNPIESIGHFSGELMESLDSLFSDMFNQYKIKGENTASMCFESIRKILSILPARNATQLSKIQLSALNAQLHSICAAADIIHKNFANSIHISDALKVSLMSKTLFCEAFKKFTGVTFSSYVSSSRLSIAARNLTITDMSLSEIADKVGFSSKSHLIHTFSDKILCTPTEYRTYSRAWCLKYAPHWLPVT